MFGIDPQQLTRCGIERHHRPPRTSGCVYHSLDHERRAFQFVLRARSKVIGFEAPGDHQFAEVGTVDLIERRVVMVTQIPAVGRPFAVIRT
jgi:hypothetical protein